MSDHIMDETPEDREWRNRRVDDRYDNLISGGMDYYEALHQVVAEECKRERDRAPTGEFTDAILRLSRDLREASEKLSENEARFLVAGYYNLQELRIRCDAQVRTLGNGAQPHVVIGWLADQSRTLEQQVAGALNRFSRAHRFGKWPRSIVGIGPVITAGLIAHTDMAHLPTAGHLWSFAGYNPESKWGKGQKRPWNPELKVLCWKIGQSFVKQQSNPNDIYGAVYKTRKNLYIERNESGGFAENAKRQLEKFNWNKGTDAYKAYAQGKLPPAHIDAMSRRYAVKLFLAHYWEVCYHIEHRKAPPAPYPIVHLGHAHIIPPPNFDAYAYDSHVNGADHEGRTSHAAREDQQGEADESSAVGSAE